MPLQSKASSTRLRKHADYQRVYLCSRKHFSKQMTYFFVVRPLAVPDGLAFRGADIIAPRVGLTVGKVMGKAVDRNRIKRRMRELIRRNMTLLHGSVDVILHPRRSILDIDFGTLDREVRSVFLAIQRQVDRGTVAIADPSRDRDEPNGRKVLPSSRPSAPHS